MDINDAEPTKEVHIKKRIFANSAKYIKASFILGIVVVLLTVAAVFATDYLAPIEENLPYHLKKLPSYVNIGFILVLAIPGTVLGGLSFRKEINIYGILGFIMNLIGVGFMVTAIIIVSTSSW